jgi:vancomycin resistance protein YoaR
VALATQWDDGPDREDHGGRVVLALILGLALLSGAAYVGAYVAAGNKIPVGTTVAGVDIGGHSPSGAETTLREGLASRADTPFTVRINGRSQQVRPAQVGLGVNYAATVRRAGAVRSWRLSHLWAYYTSDTAFQPVVTLDQSKLAALLHRLDTTDGRTATNGSVVFRGQTFVVHSPRPGFVLDPQSAGTAFWNAYLSDNPTVQLQLTPTNPEIDARAIQRFVRTFANRAVAASVELRFGHTTVQLVPADYARLLAAREVGRSLKPTVQAKALASVTDKRLVGDTVDRPRDATVALVNGHPHVVKAQPGLHFAPQAVAAALIQAIRSPDRAARVRSTPEQASFTNADARALGIRREVSSFSVRVPGGHNDRLAAVAQRLNGTVLEPGDTFSLRRALGAETPEGASGAAVATGLFNAAWLGGLQVTAHTEGATYSSAYPMGRDASLRQGQDLALRNDSRYGVLVSVVPQGGSLSVSLWSTPRWTVTSSDGPRTNVVHRGRVVRHGASCQSQNGSDGFDVTVTRSFTPVGSQSVDHTSSYTAHYAPVPKVVCRSH